MKLAVMPKELVWWGWLLTAALLVTGLTGIPAGFIAALALLLAKTLFYWWKLGRVSAMGVQIRLSYTLVLALCFIPQFHWLFWLAAAGTVALLVFGYCLMGRTLSLLPWNRVEPLSLDLLRRTFLSPPVVTHEAVRSACGGLNGVCELESRVASFQAKGAHVNVPLHNQSNYPQIP
jgi:hypothetical protein